MHVFFHRLAAREFGDAQLRYRRYGPPTEHLFLQAVRAAVTRIERNPAGGSLYGRSFRWVRMRRYPYLLYYAPLDPHTIEVFAFAHSARRPGYWVRRANRP